MMLYSMPIWYEPMSIAKTQKICFLPFPPRKIAKTAKRQMSPAQWGDICHPLIMSKTILIICQELSYLVF